MWRIRLILILLAVAAFSLATMIQPRHDTLQAEAGREGGFLATVLGEGRALFAGEMFARADAYFHRGNYPSIFELTARREEDHMSEAVAAEPTMNGGEDRSGHDHHDHDGHDHEHGHDSDGDHGHEAHGHSEEPEFPPADWIEAFGQKFRAAAHVHLERGEEREMLPWLKLSTDLDPHAIEGYTVGAYWLRTRLGKVDEAERYLRDGLRHNPNNAELLNELARLNFENRKDYPRARNLWRAALASWKRTEEPKDEPNMFLLARILGGLAMAELEEERYAEAIDYFTQLKAISPSPETIQKRIDQIREKMGQSPGD